MQLVFITNAAFVAALAECMVDPVRQDQAGTSDQSNQDFHPMRWQPIAEKGARADQEQTATHQDEN